MFVFIFLLIDDGTLSPIVNDPTKAIMSPTMREAVRLVSTKFPTVVVTGWSFLTFGVLSSLFVARAEVGDDLGLCAARWTSFCRRSRSRHLWTGSNCIEEGKYPHSR